MPNNKIAFSSVKGVLRPPSSYGLFKRAVVYECVYACACMFLRLFIHSHGDQTMGAGSSILSYGSWRSISDHQARQQVPSPSEPSCHPAAECLI